MQFLPVESYFEQAYMDAELREMFSRGVRYVGHTLMAPNPDDYMVPPTMQDRYILFAQQGGRHQLISNVCLHRQARLLTGSGNTKRIVCKLHCWGYGNDGQLRTTPHYTGPMPGKGLQRRPLSAWNGMLFDGRTPELDLKAEGLEELLSFDGYFFAGVESAIYDYNWKTFAEIYLDDYHVFAIHPGLRRFVDLGDLGWSVGADYSIQWAGMTKDIDRVGSPAFQAWHAAIKRQFGDNLPRYGALWIYIYPNIMIEWYPHVIVMSTVYPLSPQKCLNHMEYYYPASVHNEDPAYFRAAKEWLDEVAAEDAEACAQQELGRAALRAHGDQAVGFVDPVLEKGVGEFYRFLAPIYGGMP